MLEPVENKSPFPEIENDLSVMENEKKGHWSAVIKVILNYTAL